MEMLQMLKFSFKHGHGLNFTAGTSSEDIEAYLIAATADSLVAEDINVYIRGLVAQSNV